MNETETGEALVAEVEVDGRPYSVMVIIPYDEPEGIKFAFPKDIAPGGRLLGIGDVADLLRQDGQGLLKQIYQLALRYACHRCSSSVMPSVLKRLSEALLASVDAHSEKAGILLGLGCKMEQRNDFSEAVRYYCEGHALHPPQPDCWYFINNNLGYSLNQLKQFAEAEPYCRGAIQADPRRYNAYKNLGVSLQGQFRYAEAVDAFLKAIVASPFETRAAGHLQDLLVEHPQILRENPALAETVSQVREAVQRLQQGLSVSGLASLGMS